MESKRDKLRGTESIVVVTRGWEGMGNGEIFVKEYKLPVTIYKFGNLMYTMVIVLYSIVSVAKKAGLFKLHLTIKDLIEALAKGMTAFVQERK